MKREKIQREREEESKMAERGDRESRLKMKKIEIRLREVVSKK